MDVTFYLADQNVARDRSRGITEYTKALMAHLAAHPEINLSAITSKSSYQGYGVRRQVKMPFATDRALGRIAADFLHPLWSRKLPFLHYPKGFLPGLQPRASILCGTVHDVILQHYADYHPEARSRLNLTYWLYVLKRSLPRFDVILTVSQFSAQAIRDFCARHRLHCPPLRITYEGCRWESESASSVEKDEYVLHLSSTEAHKRTRTLVDYWKQNAPRDLKLVLIGAATDAVKEMVAQSKSISLSPPLPTDALKLTISRARALILPSEIEGFGLPAVEAYSLGTPAVYVKGTAVEEILGEATPGGFQLGESDSFSSALEEALALSPAEIERKREELWARFSWNNCVERTVAAYKEFSTQNPRVL